nr:hypothetical protein [Tanacetum cinerariifolium]
MDTTIDQQVAIDEALVPSSQRLRIESRNFCLLSDIKSKESTLQLGKQTAKAFKAKILSALSKVSMTEAQQLKLVTKRSMQQMHISQPSGSGADEGTGDDNKEKDDDGDEEDEGDDGEEGNGDDNDDEDNEESFDPIPQTPESSDDEGSGEEDLGLNVGGEEGLVQEEEEDELYKNPTYVAPLPMTAPTMTPSTNATITTTSQAPILPTTVLSTIIQNLPNFGSLFCFDDRLRTLETNFSEAMQMNQFAGAVSTIPGIVQRYMDQRMNKAVKVAVQLQSDRLCDEAQRDNDEFLKSIDENMQKIIKEQVKEQVKVQVSKILPRIEQAMNEQLEAEVLTRLSHLSKTSYVVAADLSEMELKKILIEKMEGNKSIQISDEQKNLYKALVEAYESDKIILDTYEETVTLKRRRDDDADKDEEPSAGPDWGSKTRKEGKEPESASAPMKTTTRSAVRSTQGPRSRQASTSESALVEEPMQTTS